jgi:hypothetical protein
MSKNGLTDHLIGMMEVDKQKKKKLFRHVSCTCPYGVHFPIQGAKTYSDWMCLRSWLINVRPVQAYTPRSTYEKARKLLSSLSIESSHISSAAKVTQNDRKVSGLEKDLHVQHWPKLKKNHTNLCKNSRPTGRYLNLRSPKMIRLQWSVEKKKLLKAGHTQQKSVPRNRFHKTQNYGFTEKTPLF